LRQKQKARHPPGLFFGGLIKGNGLGSVNLTGRFYVVINVSKRATEGYRTGQDRIILRDPGSSTLKNSAHEEQMPSFPVTL
jgi:hypothetical protein